MGTGYTRVVLIIGNKVKQQSIMPSIMSVLLIEVVIDSWGLSHLSKYSACRMFVHLPADAQPREAATKRICKNHYKQRYRL